MKTRMTISASAEYILPVRLMISGIAARLGFELNDIEDIKTAVSEACLLLLFEARGGELELRAEDNGMLEIGLSITGFQRQQAAIEEMEAIGLSRTILEAMPASCEIEEAQGGKAVAIHMTFKKQG